ncbi:lipoyl(octanoyl) transferase LipB [Afifella sp. IM 167]|uniref:lipoyl(octanoyl) transferase LipB n=1 Tax=Afifella sp. IM 167 TaxID=2033586 RepID=UPI001CCC4486|nr:lipoyl(octanoyl) transferase LipB [Afifella sp. IM 167]MBZ8134525.1 lipoate-protein ligase B [Afifella sp. IM 167]
MLRSERTLDETACPPPEPDERFLAREGSDPVELIVSQGLVDYPEALAFMDERAAAIRAGTARECLWLLQHPPLYTAGTSAVADDLLTPDRFPVFRTGRGGQFTYHGPGQRVAYVLLDLERRRPDIRRYVRALEAWLILTLAAFGVKGERREGRVGIWVERPERSLPGAPVTEDKIAAIGVRVRRWVTLHGIALNVSPELEHFSGIVPCGISGHGVTSLADLGASENLAEADRALSEAFRAVFGPLGSEAGSP